MYTASNRANSIFSYTTFVLAFLIIANIISKFFLPSNPQAEIKLNRIERFSKNYNNDQAIIIFDLKADLTSLFNWNTKQVFVFVTCEYKTKKNVLNQVVIWDSIIEYKKDAVLNLSEQVNKYLFIDQGYNLRNTKVNLTFNWEISPISGLLEKRMTAYYIFTMPQNYSEKNYF